MKQIDLESVNASLSVYAILLIAFGGLFAGVLLCVSSSDMEDDFFNQTKFENTITITGISTFNGDMMVETTHGEQYRVQKALNHIFEVGKTYDITYTHDYFYENCSGVIGGIGEINWD